MTLPRSRMIRHLLVLAIALAAATAIGTPQRASAAPVDFTLTGLDGKPHRLADYRGKWVVVNYWATWCPPCLTEIPELVNFHEDHRTRDAVVLGINFEDISVSELKAFAEDYFISYPLLLEKPGRKSVLGEIPGLPTTFIISPAGEIAARQVGSVTAEMIESFILRENNAGPPNEGF